MYCPKCGAQNDDNAWKCIRCGESLHQTSQTQYQPPTHISNYLVPAILCTIFCCVPFGIPAIVFAAQVNSKAAAGDVNGAIIASQKAKTWCWISFGIGLGIGLIYLIIVIIGAATGEM